LEEPWSNAGACVDNKCYVPPGATCGPEPTPEEIQDLPSYPGFESLYCATGYCLYLHGKEPQCSTLGDGGTGCEEDSDCVPFYVVIREGYDNGDYVNDGACVNKKCHIPPGSTCSMLNFLATPTGLKTEFCATGYCLSDGVVRGEPYCGTIGKHGRGCDSDFDCHPFYEDYEGTCFMNKCYIPDGADCRGYPEADALCGGSCVGINESHAVCLRDSPPKLVGSQMVGDPHALGGHGDMTDIRGKNNTWYNFLSTFNLSLAVFFILDTYHWHKKVVFGSWMKALAVTATTKKNESLLMLYHVEQMPAPLVTAGNKTRTLQGGDSIEMNGVRVACAGDAKTVLLSNGAWAIKAKNRFLPYKHMNDMKRRLDLSIWPTGDVDHDPVAPHGLIGQSYDRDDKKVLGALDDYKIPGKVIVTKAMGEGAIEGIADDYEINGADPFSTYFKFSRFGRMGIVPPRNVSALSGLVLPAKMGAAGILNDEPDV
jgi:hypothetical protein